jgi:PAS domain S-box-containing protein
MWAVFGTSRLASRSNEAVSIVALTGRASGLAMRRRQAVLSRLLGLAILVVGVAVGIAADRWDQRQRDRWADELANLAHARATLWQESLDTAVERAIAHAGYESPWVEPMGVPPKHVGQDLPASVTARLAPTAHAPTHLVISAPGATPEARIETRYALDHLLRLNDGERIIGIDRLPDDVAPESTTRLSVGDLGIAVIARVTDGPRQRPPILAWALMLSAIAAAAVDSSILRARKRHEMLNLAEGRLLDARAEIVQHQATSETAERALRQAERAYQKIFDNAMEGIFQTTLDGRYIRVNKALANIYGYETPAALIRGLTDIAGNLYVDPQRRDTFAQIMRAHGSVTDFRSQVRRRDGRVIWIAENAHAVHDETGEVTHYEGTVVDISARKALEDEMHRAREAAEQAHRAKSAFLAAVSHELKTPLNVILGFSELVENETHGELGDARYRDYARDIRLAGRRLLDTINDVIALSQAEAGTIDVTASLVDPIELAETALAGARAAAEEAGLSVDLVTAGDVPPIEADARLLLRCIGALMSNAVKFTPAGGNVRIVVGQTPDHGVQISVVDTGIGIGEAQVSAVLGAFQQGDSSLGRRYEGLGVGLPLVKAVADLHGAELRIEGRPEGGTRVTLGFRPARHSPRRAS